MLEKPKITLGKSGSTEKPLYADLNEGVFSIR